MPLPIAALLCLVALFASMLLVPAYAQQEPAVAHMEVERDNDGIYVNASMVFLLPELVEDALEKGIPMTFIAQADVVKERWYWWDYQVASVRRYLRVTYQPLTRRWRLSVSTMPFDTSGLGVSVGQTYENWSDVLAALQRIARWKVADASELVASESYRVHFRFQLDLSQLPRPLQIGALGRSDWSLSMARSERARPLTKP